MRSTAFISTLALLAVAAVNPVVARPGGEPSLVARAPSPSLVARAPSPSLAARAPAPSGSFTKRALRQKPLSPEEAVAQQLCPGTMRACPIDAQSSPATLLEWIQEGFECVDPQEDLTSCGGCGTTDIKFDCTAIKGAQAVSCIVGACRVDSCEPGYTRSLDGSSCIRTR